MTSLLIGLQMAYTLRLPTQEHITLCGQAAEEIERLQNAWASAVSRAVRAEDDADRLAGQIKRFGCACNHDPDASDVGECDACAVLRLHDKEVEAR